MILVAVTAIIAIAFLVSGRVTIETALHAIDVDLLLVLFALLVTVEILRASGWLDLIVKSVVGRFRTTRAFAIGMIAFMALERNPAAMNSAATNRPAITMSSRWCSRVSQLRIGTREAVRKAMHGSLPCSSSSVSPRRPSSLRSCSGVALAKFRLTTGGRRFSSSAPSPSSTSLGG